MVCAWLWPQAISGAGTQVCAEVTLGALVSFRFPHPVSLATLSHHEDATSSTASSLKTSASEGPQLSDSGKVLALPEPQLHPGSPPSSIRQYELMVHTDMDMAKVYTGEMGRLKSYENQKP